MYDIYNSLCAMSGKTSYVLGQLPLTKNTKQKKKKKKKKNSNRFIKRVHLLGREDSAV
jgi:hypothetical protein